ncbi:MAG: sugar ABC transporter permease [Clostridia bacterium]|nr:sugar ABC transporter permease [Clostridia bacterium]
MKKKSLQVRIREWLPGYMFLLPAMFFFILFVVYPMIKGIIISFYNYTATSYEFNGLGNFIFLLKDEVFIKSLQNTILFVIGNVPLVLIFSLFVSIVIYNKSEFTRSFFRAVFYLPAVSSIVTISIVWKWIYSPRGGILNKIIESFGAQPINWLGDERYALTAMIIILFTLSVGQPIILYIAALGNIPKDYIEVADLDGATAWQKFTNIYWPLILPTTLYIVIITTINSFQTFAIVQLLTGGGPFYRTSTILFSLYKSAFELQNYGLASAMGVILSVIVVIISVIQYKYLSTDVEY